MGIAILLINLAFTIINKCILNKSSYFLLSIPIVFITIAFACYQSTIPLMITFSAFFAMLFFKEKDEKILKIIIEYIIIFLISFFAYKIIGMFIHEFAHIGKSPYIANQILWGKEQIKITIINVINEIFDIILAKNMYYNLALLICIVEFIYIIFNKFKMKNWVFYIAVITFLISPFLMNIILGGETAIRSQLSIPIVTALGIYFIYLYTDNEVHKKIYIIVFGIIISYQLITSVKLFISDYDCFTQQRIIAENIEKELEENNISTDKTLIFVGNIPARGDDIIYGEVMGHTFFEWDSGSEIGSNRRIRNFLGAVLGYNIYELPSPEQYEEAKEKARKNASISTKRIYTRL